MYDAIIIGSRCAGASTALLLARRGRRVLVLDRALFPRDVLSGHTIQPAGVAHLARWGLLERVQATGVPFASHFRFDVGDVVLEGSPVPVDGIDAAVCIRRTVLDPLLADAAAEAGAEVRLGVSVTGLLRDGDRVVGVVARDAAGRRFEARAPIVIGADGVHSFLARAVEAPSRDVRPASTVAVYSYWRGLPVQGVELYVRPRAFVVVTPTNDGLTFVALQVPVDEAGRYRGAVDHSFTEALSTHVPSLAERIAGAERAERFRFSRTPDAFKRQAAGPGWALVGDAGCHKDPITAQGMLDAFRDAEALAAAVDRGLDDDLDQALTRYHHDRDTAVADMYELTAALADLTSPAAPEVQALLAALPGQPHHIARFLGVIAGTVPVADFYGPESVAAITGVTEAA